MTVFKKTFYSLFTLMLIFLIVIIFIFTSENIRYNAKINNATTSFISEELVDNLKKRAICDSLFITKALKASYIYHDYECINNLVTGAIMDVDIIAVIATSTTNNVIAFQSDREFKETLEEIKETAGHIMDWPDNVSFTLGQDIIIAKNPVSILDERLGGLIMVYSTRNIEKAQGLLVQSVADIQKKAQSAFLVHTLTTFISMLFILLVVSFLLASHIAKPLKTLGAKIMDMGDSRGNKKIEYKSKDEIKILAQNIEETSTRLQQTMVSKGYLEFLIESMDDAILVFDDNGTIKTANLPAILTLGEENTANNLSRLIYPERDGCRELLKSKIKNMKIEIETEGELRIFLVSTSFLSTNRKEMLCVMRDITQQQQIAETALFNATHDPLTGLLNRSGLMQSIDELDKETRSSSWLLAFDLERFNNINTGLGYLSGDRVLQTIGERLKQASHNEASASRTGADEFAVIIFNCDSIDCASQKSEEIEETVKMPIFVEGREIWISLTATLLPLSSNESSGKLLEEVSKCIHRDKANKRGLLIDANNDPLMETHLKQALEKDELSLRFQPIVDIETGRINALEALVRWDSPERGIVTPDQFIPFAEETGLIVLMGKQIIDKAIRAQRQLIDMGIHTTMHINVSARQLGINSLVQHFKKAIERNGIKASSIMVEITESCLIRSKGEGLEEIDEFKKMGMRISVDDFGSGYSSLSILQTRPFDQLKMDQTLLPWPENQQSNSVAQSIINLARELGKPIIIEGVETMDQLNNLKSMGARYIQGYLFSKSVKLEELKPLFSKKNIEEWY